MSVKVKQGNTCVLQALIKDADGNTVTTLAQATEVLFKVIDRSSRVVKISKSLSDGIVVNSPSTGYIRVTLEPTDTEDLVATMYLMGLQIKWSDTIIYEVDLSFSGKVTEYFELNDDVVG